MSTGSPARRAWHLASATIGQDETIAELMEAAADDAGRRGAHAVAASTLERSAGLSPARDRRLARMLAAALEHELAGQSDRALAVLEEARERDPDITTMVEIDRLRGRVLVNRGPLSEAHEVLAHAAHTIEASHPIEAAGMLTEAALACFIAGRVEMAEALSRRAFELTGGRDDDAGEIVHLLFTGMLVNIGHRQEAAAHIQGQLQRFVDLQAAGNWQMLVLASIWLIWAEEHAHDSDPSSKRPSHLRGAWAPQVLCHFRWPNSPS